MAVKWEMKEEEHRGEEVTWPTKVGDGFMLQYSKPRHFVFRQIVDFCRDVKGAMLLE